MGFERLRMSHIWKVLCWLLQSAMRRSAESKLTPAVRCPVLKAALSTGCPGWVTSRVIGRLGGREKVAVVADAQG
jgi:hypothetical protein